MKKFKFLIVCMTALCLFCSCSKDESSNKKEEEQLNKNCKIDQIILETSTDSLSNDKKVINLVWDDGKVSEWIYGSEHYYLSYKGDLLISMNSDSITNEYTYNSSNQLIEKLTTTKDAFFPYEEELYEYNSSGQLINVYNTNAFDITYENFNYQNSGLLSAYQQTLYISGGIFGVQDDTLYSYYKMTYTNIKNPLISIPNFPFIFENFTLDKFIFQQEFLVKTLEEDAYYSDSKITTTYEYFFDSDGKLDYISNNKTSPYPSKYSFKYKCE